MIRKSSFKQRNFKKNQMCEKPNMDKTKQNFAVFNVSGFFFMSLNSYEK